MVIDAVDFKGKPGIPLFNLIDIRSLKKPVAISTMTLIFKYSRLSQELNELPETLIILVFNHEMFHMEWSCQKK